MVPANETVGVPSQCVYHYHTTPEPPYIVGCYGPVDSLQACKELYTADEDGNSMTGGCLDGTDEILLADSIGAETTTERIDVVRRPARCVLGVSAMAVLCLSCAVVSCQRAPHGTERNCALQWCTCYDHANATAPCEDVSVTPASVAGTSAAAALVAWLAPLAAAGAVVAALI